MKVAYGFCGLFQMGGGRFHAVIKAGVERRGKNDKYAEVQYIKKFHIRRQVGNMCSYKSRHIRNASYLSKNEPTVDVSLVDSR